MIKVAFLVQLPKHVSPGQRFRIEQYEPLLEKHGFQLDAYPFIGPNTYRVLYRPGFILQKVSGVLAGLFKRFWFLFKAKKYDFIFLQREATPIGPPVFEWVLAKIFKKKLILDFDDAIWLSNVTESNRLISFIKCFWKVKWLCRWSYKIAVGNQYLFDYAAKYNKNVILIPTSVDTERYSGRGEMKKSKVTIGWTGSHSTLKYLNFIFPLLKMMEKKHEFEFLVICNTPPFFKLQSMRFIQWNTSSEIDDLLKIDIGVMPLEEDQWSEGKCGFKLIQYLALGIPAVASPVGVNKSIIEMGINGFLCSSLQEWEEGLEKLLCNPDLRSMMGEKGRGKIISTYSLQANAPLFLSLFEKEVFEPASIL